MNVTQTFLPVSAMHHSRFDAKKFNEMVRHYQSELNDREYPEVTGYEDFSQKYPLSTREDLRAISVRLIASGQLTNCCVVSTSGTTGEPLVLVNRIWRDAVDGSYPIMLFQYLAENVFSKHDVVANLCFPGGLGLLYEGMCTVLEPMGLTILPIGRLDSFKNDRTHYKIFQQLGLNTLVGSPASIAEFARITTALGVKLDVHKLVFSAESFHTSKREFIKEIWPRATFYSLYGSTEFGLAAIGTPDLPTGHHHLIDSWFVFETDADGALYVTDLKSPMIPVIRYQIGDRGTLVSNLDGSTQFVVGGRCDSSFNFAGALLRIDTIRDRIRVAKIPEAIRKADLQLILQSNSDGRDMLIVVLDCDLAETDDAANSILDAVGSIHYIREDIARGVVELSVRDRLHLHTTRRGKRPDIVDLR